MKIAWDLTELDTLPHDRVRILFVARDYANIRNITEKETQQRLAAVCGWRTRFHLTGQPAFPSQASQPSPTSDPRRTDDHGRA